MAYRTDRVIIMEPSTDPSNGAKYKGELKNGIPHGQGTYTWSNADGIISMSGGSKTIKNMDTEPILGLMVQAYVGGFNRW